MAILALAIACLAAILTTLAVIQRANERRNARVFAPPGRLVDIGGGRQLHARVMGSGVPTVVFEAGISASSTSWTALQPRVAEMTGTVSYDRAGLGWSPLPRDPLDANRLVSDLAALLNELRAPAPYILVGHSYGALLVRLFAERYPDKIAGLVLLDPVLAWEWAKPDLRHRRMLRAACILSSWGGLLARFGVVRFASAPLLRDSITLPKLIGKASAGPAAGVVDRLASEIGKLPRETWPIVRAQWCRPSSFRAMANHLRALPSSFTGLRDAPCDFPIVVISEPNLSPQGLAEHRRIAALSSRGEHVVSARGGHWVHLDAPELVADAIGRVLGAVARPLGQRS